MNYTPETTKYIVEHYCEKPTRETVEALALELDKTIKSIIGKLSREGVYRRQIYTTKRGEPPITKAEIVASIATLLEFEELLGLDKAPKLVLAKIQKKLEENAKRLGSN